MILPQKSAQFGYNIIRQCTACFRPSLGIMLKNEDVPGCDVLSGVGSAVEDRPNTDLGPKAGGEHQFRELLQRSFLGKCQMSYRNRWFTHVR